MKLEYSSGMTFADADKLARRLLHEDATLRKLGGQGNYVNVQVKCMFEMNDTKRYSVFVVPKPTGQEISYE